MSTAELDKKTLKIDGMHCASCSAAVEKSLRQTDGVEDASVNLASETALDSYNHQAVTNDDLKEAVESAGYSVAKEKAQTQTLKVEGMHCASCVNTVEDWLMRMDSVQEAVVNLATDSVKVSYTGNLTLNDFKDPIENAGYKLLKDQST